jgi:D-alanine-D-alanine ligase
VEAFKATSCEGMARVDFLVEKSSGQIYINEVNTIPGFTSISMFPKMLEHDGIGFSELLDRLIQWGIDRHGRYQRTRFER